MEEQYVIANAEVLAENANELVNLLALADKNLNTMIENIEVLNSMWTGSAKDKFMSQFLHDFEEIKELISSLHDDMRCIDYASRQYELCKEHVVELINAIDL